MNNLKIILITFLVIITLSSCSSKEKKVAFGYLNLNEQPIETTNPNTENLKRYIFPIDTTGNGKTDIYIDGHSPVNVFNQNALGEYLEKSFNKNYETNLKIRVSSGKSDSLWRNPKIKREAQFYQLISYRLGDTLVLNRKISSLLIEGVSKNLQKQGVKNIKYSSEKITVAVNKLDNLHYKDYCGNIEYDKNAFINIPEGTNIYDLENYIYIIDNYSAVNMPNQKILTGQTWYGRNWDFFFPEKKKYPKPGYNPGVH